METHNIPANDGDESLTRKKMTKMSRKAIFEANFVTVEIASIQGSKRVIFCSATNFYDEECFTYRGGRVREWQKIPIRGS